MGLNTFKKASSSTTMRKAGAKRTQLLLNSSMNRAESTTGLPGRSMFRARSMANVNEDDDTVKGSKPGSNNITPFIQRSEEDLDKPGSPDFPTISLTVIDFKKHMKFTGRSITEFHEFDPTPMQQAKVSL
jgi:hypothetical protein